MVNFRYHLVSLIAVFLALAVGVVLGAGPLQNAITSKNEKTAEKLEYSQLEAQLEDLGAVAQQGEVLAQAFGSEVLPDQLKGATVALVLLPGVTPEEVAPVAGSIETAGGEVTAEVKVTEAFVSQDGNTYRETLAQPLSSHLVAKPADTEASAVLATGIVETLTLTGAETQLVRDMLTDEANPLIEAGTLPENPVDSIVLIGPAAEPELDEEGDSTQSGSTAATGQSGEGEAESGRGEVAPLTTKAWLALASAVATAEVKSVAVGQSQTPGDFVLVLRESNSPIATVDQGGSEMAALNVALVLASGAQGQFGQQTGATSVLAPLP